MPGDTETGFVLVDDDEEPTDFELVDVPAEVELRLVTDPSPGLVPVRPEPGVDIDDEEETTEFVLVDDEEETTEFVLVDDDSSPDILPAADSRLELHRDDPSSVFDDHTPAR